MSWSTFIDSAPASEHAVQVYDDPADLVATAAGFFGAGLAEGAPALVLATGEHWDAFAAALRERGHDLDAAERDGLVTVRDADATLARLLEHGRVSAAAFERHVGGLVDEIAARFPGGTIRAFGELVDLLWHREEREQALVLEDLWNGLQQTRPVALLCAYHLDVFDVGVQCGGLADVFHRHTHARPVTDSARLSAAVDKALSEIVGARAAARIYLGVAEQVPRGSIPRGQAVIGWLCRADEPVSAAVLARAREHYAV